MNPRQSNSVATVSGNDWSALVPPPDHEWTPTLTVSVCIPTRNPGVGLRNTLRALALQTYPHQLMEVIIGDDGSDHEIIAPSDLPFPVRIARQDRTLDFGAGQARNTAARAASGDVLVFLDADVMPERQVVECYARWFTRSDLVVPMGLCRFFDDAELNSEQICQLLRDDAMSSHLAGKEVDDQRWREATFRRTNDLQIEAVDAFRVIIGATLAVSARQHSAVGGFPELGLRGVEDTEFGYRLHANGAILVLDRECLHWHQGRRNLSSERRAEIDRQRAPYVQRLIPVPGFRHGEPVGTAPVETVPMFRVHVGEGPGAEQTRAIVRSSGPNSVLADQPIEGFDASFAHVHLPAGRRWNDDISSAIGDLFRRHAIGVIRVLSTDPSAGQCSIVRTRALHRAASVDPEADQVELSAELFGEWLTTDDAVGLTPRVSPGPRSDESVNRQATITRSARRVLNGASGAVVRALERWAS